MFVKGGMLTKGDDAHSCGQKAHAQWPLRHLLEQRHQHGLHIESKAVHGKRLWNVSIPLHSAQSVSVIHTATVYYRQSIYIYHWDPWDCNGVTLAACKSIDCVHHICKTHAFFNT